MGLKILLIYYKSFNSGWWVGQGRGWGGQNCSFSIVCVRIFDDLGSMFVEVFATPLPDLVLQGLGPLIDKHKVAYCLFHCWNSDNDQVHHRNRRSARVSLEGFVSFQKLSVFLYVCMSSFYLD